MLFFGTFTQPLPNLPPQVNCTGRGLNEARLNRTNSFTVDCSRAGNNILYVGVYGPEIPCDEVGLHFTGLPRNGPQVW